MKKDDGAFWMTIEDFTKNYDQVVCNKTNYTNKYTSLKVTLNKSQAFFIKVVCKSNTTGTFAVT